MNEIRHKQSTRSAYISVIMELQSLNGLAIDKNIRTRSHEVRAFRDNLVQQNDQALCRSATRIPLQTYPWKTKWTE